ncbi:MAG: hypothetical protein ACTS1Z_07170 [Parasphingopyxis sp.]|uniref:hypothetical protein n=1 Tax=Parasphingopyxis sp. TaxID=1920299 RepID=UPI003FA13E7E
MGEEKFASLSSGLLARKGAAKPAMRRQAFINPQGDVTEDLGWNDMGHEGPHTVQGDQHHGEAPLPEVHKQREELEKGLSESPDEPVDADDSEYPDIGDHMVEHHAFEPYESNGHSGLSPMDAEDDVGDDAEKAESQSGEQPQTVGEYSQEPASAVDAPEAVVPHGESPLSTKSNVPEPKTPEPVSKPAEETKADSVPAREKVAFTLRLDKERHLKLRLASAITNQSAQRLVTEALDRFLEEHPDVQSIASQSADGKTH